MLHEVFDVNGNPLQAESSPNEPWYDSREIAVREKHWYVPLVDFALESLGQGAGSCLVVGSPIFEALELEALGWKVDYLDVRKPPLVHWIEGDASAMPIGEMAYDAISSTCVMCHVGLGRYGDALTLDGDFAMMCEIQRVLKPGGLAAICVGPVADCQFTRKLGSLHRVYVKSDVEALVSSAGLDILRTQVLNTQFACWREPGESPGKNVENIPDYLSMLLKRA